MDPAELSRETLVAQALGGVDPVSGGLAPVINLSTNYEQKPDGSYHQDRVYTRADNPTYEDAEALIAALEGAGCACALFSSGMAASTAVFQSLLPGDHVLVGRILYWGVRKWLAEFGLAWGLDVEFVDTTDLGAVESAIRPGHTRLVWLETPANPTWEITDLDAVCRIPHAAGARVAVDNTVATPVLTRPIELGADLVVHSATKYLNGHSDVLAGAVVTARRDPFWERIRSWRRNAGSVLGPFEAWLLQRGMRTLFLRVRRSAESALALARELDGHPALAAILYPGLASHPGHDIAARQMIGGFGGMLSLRLEAIDDLRADLIAALDGVSRAGNARAPVAPTEPHTVPHAAGLEHAVAAALERTVAPSVIARGGSIRLLDVSEGVVTLEAQGSPGAVLPSAERIEEVLRAAAPQLTRVRVVWPAGEPAPLDTGGVAERVRRVLEDEVNSAVAAHGGPVVLVGVVDGTVRIRLEGGCQGCSLAEVTVRQGIERLLRARVPEVVALVDITNHEAGT